MVGTPGGSFHFRKGLVIAVDSPGAPGAEALLLRSGRVSEEDWTAAVREGVETRSHRAELAARGNIGSTELQVVAMMAAQDGAFAVAAGDVEEHVVDDVLSTDVLLPVVRGVDAEELLRETTRRLAALAALPCAVSPHRERVVPAPGVDLSTRLLTAERREILTHATGRRSARDIAYAVGRSVYPVTVEVSRLLGEELLVLAATTPVSRASLTSLRPRHPSAAVPDAVPEPDLPRREPGPSNAPEDQHRARSSGWQALSRLFNRSGTERKHVGP
jgi:hypothetical protein